MQCHSSPLCRVRLAVAVALGRSMRVDAFVGAAAVQPSRCNRVCVGRIRVRAMLVVCAVFDELAGLYDSMDIDVVTVGLRCNTDIWIVDSIGWRCLCCRQSSTQPIA